MNGGIVAKITKVRSHPVENANMNPAITAANVIMTIDIFSPRAP